MAALMPIPKISNLSSLVIRVLGCNPSPMTLQGTNTYIIGKGNRRLLLDTGENGNVEYIKNLTHVLEKDNICLESIVITHWHHDHIGGLNDVLKSLPDKRKPKVFKYRRLDQPDAAFVSEIEHFNWLTGNEQFTIDGATLRVLHTPGHSTDHIVLQLVEENAIFSGDCILGEGTAVFEDLHDYMKSLEIILKKEPSLIYPGHGPLIEEPLPKIKYYIDHRNQREMEILKVLQKDPTSEFSPIEIVKIIYKDTPDYLHAAAANNVSLHLGKLKKEGKVTESEEEGKWRIQMAGSPHL